MMKDLLEKLTILTEAPVKPGDRKEISFKLKKLDKVSNELYQYKQSLNYMEAASTLPPALKQEMAALQEKLNAEIDKVQKAYDASYQKSLVNDRPVKMDNLFKALSKHCKEIIKVYKELNKNTFTTQRFIYRGTRSSEDALYGKPFEARKPKDSNTELHDMVNATLKHNGFEANRENAMFVTGDRSQASGYGYSLYVMFPVDGFKFTWSQTVKDLVLDSGKKLEMMDRDIVDQIRAIVTDAKKANPELPFPYPNELFSSGYSYDSDYERLADAVDKGLIPDTVQDLLDSVLTNESIQKHFKFTDQDLFRAILSNKEIYIKSPYYAVNVSHMDELIRFLKEVDDDSVKLPESFGEMPDTYDKGDVVTITKGDYEGKLGTITYVYSDSVEVFINQQSGDVTVPTADVSLYKSSDGSIPLFEKGDKIIVTDFGSPQFGTVASVFQSYPNGKIEFENENGNFFTGYKHQFAPYSEELEKQVVKDLETKPPQLKVNDDVIVSDPDSEYYGDRGRINYIYGTGKVEVNIQKKDTYIEFQPDQLVLTKNAPAELLKTTPGVYHLGDKVQIIGGEYKGYYATVDYLYTSSEKAEVDLTGMDKKVDVLLTDLQHYGQKSTEAPFKVGDRVKITAGDDAGEEAIVNYVSTVYPDEIDVKLVKNDYIRTVPISSVKLVTDQEPETVESPDTIKVGDTVKVISSESSYFGHEGPVVAVGENASGKKWVKFENGVKTFTDWVEKTEPAAAQFQMNDKVKIVNKSYSADGSIATVIGGPDNAGVYKVVTTDGKLLATLNNQMEKLPDEPAKPTFSVGDAVKITDDWNLYKHGEPGVVAKLYPDYGTIGVDFPDGSNATYLDTEITKAEDNAVSFQIGDYVKINDPTSSYNNEIGKVEKGPDSDGDYVVAFTRLGVGKWTYSQPSTLTKVDKPAASVNYKLGDVIQVTDQSRSDYGKIGKINFIYPSGALGLEFEDGPGGIVQASQIKKYGLSTKLNDLDNLTFEPEPEPAPPSSKLAVGDKVEVINTYPSLIGKTGTITQAATPPYEFVSVKLDGNTDASSFPSSALKKVDNSASEPQSSGSPLDSYSIGDMVEVINPKLSTFGMTGKVVDASNTYLFIDFPEYKDAAVKPTSVKKVG